MDTEDTSLKTACTLVPAQSFNLLIPNCCIAEVLIHTIISSSSPDNSWYIGNTLWNGEEIPIISFEKLDPAYSFKQKDKSIIVIVNYPSPDKSKIFHFGIMANQFPQVVQANNQTIDRELNPKNSHQYALSYVYIDGKSALIPDLPRITNSMLRNLRKSA